jgi:multiple sugar transport system substrate-binding protein
MMKIRSLRLPLTLGIGALVAVSASACTGAPSSADSGNVTITVGNQPTTDQAASREVFDKQVKAFEAANPKITLKPSTTLYDATTSQTMLAGGTLPDVLQIPFTELQTPIARKQLADITAQVKQLGLTGTLNPATLAIAQDSAKKIYGIPTSAYAVGLNYNRELFSKAGLDPNSPPTTWAQVEADAKKITAATGATGFAQMSNQNCGGWMFTAMTYDFGGTLENAKGTVATFANNNAASNALDLIHKMKWDDKSMGSQNLYDCGTIQQDFAAGKIGMYLKAPDDYTNATVQYKMSPQDFGAAGMPTYDGKPRSTLTGGAVAVVNPKTTSAQKLAAVKWINFEYLSQYTDKKVAVAIAKAAVADHAPVAVPGLPVVSATAYKTYFGWISQYNNVPVKNFAPYTASLKSVRLVPEPKNSAQKVYASLDSIIQNVLTNNDVDIKPVLKNAQSAVTSQLAQ